MVSHHFRSLIVKLYDRLVINKSTIEYIKKGRHLLPFALIGKTPLAHLTIDKDDEDYDPYEDDNKEAPILDNDIFKQIIIDGVLTSLTGPAYQVSNVINMFGITSLIKVNISYELDGQDAEVWMKDDIGDTNPNIRELTFSTHDEGHGDPNQHFVGCMRGIFESFLNLTSLTIKSRWLGWFDRWEDASTLTSLTHLQIHGNIYDSRSLESYLESQATIKSLTYSKRKSDSKDTLLAFLLGSKCKIDIISTEMFIGEAIPLVQQRRIRSLTIMMRHIGETQSNDQLEPPSVDESLVSALRMIDHIGIRFGYFHRKGNHEFTWSLVKALTPSLSRISLDEDVLQPGYPDNFGVPMTQESFDNVITQLDDNPKLGYSRETYLYKAIMLYFYPDDYINETDSDKNLPQLPQLIVDCIMMDAWRMANDENERRWALGLDTLNHHFHSLIVKSFDRLIINRSFLDYVNKQRDLLPFALIGKTPLRHLTIDMAPDFPISVLLKSDLCKQMIVDGVLTSLKGPAYQVSRVIGKLSITSLTKVNISYVLDGIDMAEEPMSDIGDANPNIRELTFSTDDGGHGEPIEIFEGCMEDIYGSFTNLVTLTVESIRLSQYDYWSNASKLTSLTGLHLHGHIQYTSSLVSYLESQSTIKSFTYFNMDSDSEVGPQALVTFLLSSKCNIDNISIELFIGQSLPLAERRLRSLTIKPRPLGSDLPNQSQLDHPDESHVSALRMSDHIGIINDYDDDHKKRATLNK
ncbi:hypothetical protein SAMD00019534_006090 [Acytostelium subglobosum LB1]|uniref:hypothetical protein n=1 Tax=Acytostelium subglobosum LB1 TaxID=1410327 RepID=UPI000644D263|nr:hypothetical protein SAMD00019534_006090 [Acytostelium subglobosum LB1]GAM17434.1 hypothetical protein SAMD00019534_006090 [Acytostelium subglobosum LB1]|eukprot:XP_012759496.1 hypothetical protein SAMD00019534_006090 [Acytostelium subglobosum LB1]